MTKNYEKNIFEEGKPPLFEDSKILTVAEMLTNQSYHSSTRNHTDDST